MPEPDPHGIEEGHNWPRGLLVYHWPCGNIRHRNARAERILRNAQFGEWSCRECGEAVPFSRRADAVFCREGCRKAAQRRRRKAKAATSKLHSTLDAISSKQPKGNARG